MRPLHNTRWIQAYIKYANALLPKHLEQESIFRSVIALYGLLKKRLHAIVKAANDAKSPSTNFTFEDAKVSVVLFLAHV